MVLLLWWYFTNQQSKMQQSKMQRPKGKAGILGKKVFSKNSRFTLPNPRGRSGALLIESQASRSTSPTDTLRERNKKRFLPFFQRKENLHGSIFHHFHATPRQRRQHKKETRKRQGQRENSPVSRERHSLWQLENFALQNPSETITSPLIESQPSPGAPSRAAERKPKVRFVPRHAAAVFPRFFLPPRFHDTLPTLTRTSSSPSHVPSSSSRL